MDNMNVSAGVDINDLRAADSADSADGANDLSAPQVQAPASTGDGDLERYIGTSPRDIERLHAVNNAAQHQRLVERVGKFRAKQIMSITRCGTCQGRLRPYTDPKDGAAGNRAYGVKPSQRCIKCGRVAA